MTGFDQTDLEGVAGWYRLCFLISLRQMVATRFVSFSNREPLKASFSFGSIILLLATLSLGTGASSYAQSEYSGDGTPTPLEEEIRWRVNRGRFDSASENQAQGTSYTDIPATAGPLAPNESLSVAARHHSEDMARNNIFQHNTVPGSAYYNPVTQPLPWDRLHAEGYTYSSAAENISAGYSGAEAAYLGWWTSTGHRVNMYKSNLLEIGNGYFYWSNSSYRRYYTMDLGRHGSDAFFTDTIFQDSNGNGAYDAGEGIPGIAVKLMLGTTVHGDFDVSAAAGNFALPFQTIAAGAPTAVVLSNATTSSVTLSIPTTYSGFESVVLDPGQSLTYGTFTKPSGTTNSGFRNVTPAFVSSLLPQLKISFSSQKALLRWPTQTGLQYQLQSTSDFQTWTNLTADVLAGTGEEMTFLDSETSATQRFYRLLIPGP